MKNINKESKRNLAEEAYDVLREEIVKGSLRPNQRVVESEISKKLGMSRTPIRDALRRLELTGYVTTSRGGGLIVTDHTPSQIRGIYEIREALETMAIRLACQRATDQQIATVEEYHKSCAESANQRDINRFIELNKAFHEELYEACSNEDMMSLIRLYRDQYFDRRIVRTFSNQEWRRTIKEHQSILEAIRVRSITKAQKAVSQHIRTVMRTALERL